MPAGGTLTIETCNTEVDDEYASVMQPDVTPGRYVRLRVSDTGEGMPSEVLARAFEPFFTTKPKGEGSGLGLATVYGIITQAGGFAHIYSERSLGTTFTALLPTTNVKPVTTPQRNAPSIRPRGGETVLVVEDEDALREVTRRILARSGYMVLVAAGGAEAIHLAEEHGGSIDLLLSDVVMPKMLGKEVAERIGAIRPGIPVLFMSGYAQPVLASHGTMDLGVSLVEKPFTEAGLLAKVRAALDSRT
jgi:hypothetical protein